MLPFVQTVDAHGQGAALALREELLAEHGGCIAQDGIAHIEDGLRATVVLLQTDDPTANEGFRYGMDVAHVGTAKCIDALCIITHNHDVTTVTDESLDDVMLQDVRVLILIDHHKAVLTAQQRSNRWVTRDRRQMHQQVIIVDQAVFPLVRIV